MSIAHSLELPLTANFYYALHKNSGQGYYQVSALRISLITLRVKFRLYLQGINQSRIELESCDAV